jgi:adenosylcobinamide-GDP ribazoletransferase
MPIRAFLFALSFLTRLPVGGRDCSDAHLGASLVFFPVVGLLIGGALALLERLLRGHLSSEMLAVVLVSVLAGSTGALHLDGLSDVFDGLGGSRGDRERALSIMRDSRIGSVGAAAMVLVVIAKIVAVRDVLVTGPALTLVAFPAVARLAAVALVVCFPYARAEGLGKAFHAQARPWHLVLAAVLVTPIAVATGLGGLIAAGAALAVAFVLAGWLTRRLGGITGDACGAAIELAELGFLIAAVRT